MNEQNDGMMQAFEKQLADNGFFRDVCGEEDFDELFKASKKSKESQYNRGVLVSGGTGCGKTLFARALCPTAIFVDCLTPIGREILENESFIHDHMHEDVILDNFGLELDKNEFGQKRSLTAELIIARHSAVTNLPFWKPSLYAMFDDKKPKIGRIFITTPLTSIDIMEKYGEFVACRIVSLCEEARMTGATKRQSGINP